MRSKSSSSFELYGIFGNPLKHTLSPAMQESAFQAVGKKGIYSVFELSPALFKKTLRKISPKVIQGFNVTVPYKQTVVSYVNALTDEARSVGAVNTVFRKNKKWVGTNTDVSGFLRSLKEEAGFVPSGKKVLILGAGGAARAVAYGLAKEGASKIFIVNRTMSKAKMLSNEFSKKFSRTHFYYSDMSPKFIGEAISDADLVVNTTSLGLHEGDKSPLSKELIPKAGERKLFVDLIYHREKTTFLVNARQKGHSILNGLGMLLWQGAKAFELWTGQPAPVQVMRKTLIQQLKQNTLNQKGTKR